MNNYTVFVLMIVVTLFIATFITILVTWLYQNIYKKSEKLDEIYFNDLNQGIEEEKTYWETIDKMYNLIHFPIEGQPDDENIALILDYIKPGMRVKYVGQNTFTARKGMKGSVANVSSVKHWTHKDVYRYFPLGVAMIVNLDDGGSFGHTSPHDWEEIKPDEDSFLNCEHEFTIPRLHGHYECHKCGLLRERYSHNDL